jgi:ATP-dependent RNA helicase RhlE
MPFSSLGLSAPLQAAVAALGYLEPTPVQTEALPAILRGDDVWACAQTGSGKTAAFVLPLLQTLAAQPIVSPRPVRALILVPTRELALQIGLAIDALARHLPERLKSLVVVGGVSINPQMLALRGGTDLLVATPGRLLDLLDQNALRLTDVRHLVLDEADRLLSLGFAEELARIQGLLPATRQNLLFSATFPPAVRALAQTWLHDPTRIEIEARALLPQAVLEQRVIEVDVGKRTLLLRHLLEVHGWTRVLVFVASRNGAEQVAGKLERAGIAVATLHGDLSQGARVAALRNFEAQRVRVLVATDVAARGLDIAQLPAVVNYDLPRSAVDYTHRIGRTGRAGETGVAVSFVSAETDAHFRLIERRHHLDLARERLEGFEPTELTVPPGDPHGGVKGKRMSKKDKLRAAVARKGPGG